MPAIDRPKLIGDIEYWLPDNNTLDKTSLTKLAGLVIERVGDDSLNYAQILCESLHACAIKNLTDSRASGSEIKRETLGGHTKEYFQGGGEDFWTDYINSLDDICPLFGYNKPVSLGISISPGNPMKFLGEDLETLY